MTEDRTLAATDVDRARALADRFWEELLEREPTFATAIGDERYDDRLPDIGESGRALAEQRNRSALEELASIDRSSLDVTLRTSPDRSTGTVVSRSRLPASLQPTSAGSTAATDVTVGG